MIKMAGEAMVATISQCVDSIDEACSLLFTTSPYSPAELRRVTDDWLDINQAAS
jgi:hypothetical protein